MGSPFRGKGPVLLFAILLSAGSVAPIMIVGAVAVQLARDLSLSEGSLGVAGAVFFSAGAVGSIGLGRFADRLGWRFAAVGPVIGSTGTLLGIGLWANSWQALVILLGVGGICNGLAVPTANVAILDAIPASRRALSVGAKQAAVPAAAALAGLSVPVFAAQTGWRFVFICAALIPMVVGFQIVGLRTNATKRLRQTEIENRHGVRWSGGFALIAVAGGIGAGVGTALSVFFVLSVVHLSSAGEADAGRLLAAGSGMALVLRIAFGWLADRNSSRGFNPTGWLIIVGGLSLAIVPWAEGWVLLLVTLIAFGAGWGWPGLLHFAVINQYDHSAGRATGFLNAGTMTGAALGPLLFGMMAETWGMHIAWLVASGAAVIAGCLLLIGAVRIENPSLS